MLLQSLLLVVIPFGITADKLVFSVYNLTDRIHTENGSHINLNYSKSNAAGPLQMTSSNSNIRTTTGTSSTDNLHPSRRKWYFQNLSVVSGISNTKNDLSDKMAPEYEPEGRIQSSSIRDSRIERLHPTKKKCRWSPDGRRRQCLKRRKKKKLGSSAVNTREDSRFNSNSSNSISPNGNRRDKPGNFAAVTRDDYGFYSKKNDSLSLNGNRRNELGILSVRTREDSGNYSKSNDSLSLNGGGRNTINGKFYKRNFENGVTNIIGASIQSGDEIRTRLNEPVGSDPCSCFWNPQKCGCDCRGTLNYDDFMDLSKRFRPCSHFTFTLAGGHYYALPPNLFSDINSILTFNMSITNATFEYLLDPTPMTSSFTGVTFSDSALVILRNVSVRRGWNWTPFEKLQGGTLNAVADIVIEGCILRRLTSDFAKLVSGRVGDIRVNNSNLVMIGSAAFETFVDMKHLRLSNNEIGSIRRGDLPKEPNKLEEIDLRNNRIRHLEDNMFSDMPSLREVALSGNPFKVLSENTFHGVITRVNFRGISDFPLNCDCELLWLKDPELVDDEMIKKNLAGATCRRPRYLLGTPFENLSKEHLVCQ